MADSYQGTPYESNLYAIHPSGESMASLAQSGSSVAQPTIVDPERPFDPVTASNKTLFGP